MARQIEVRRHTDNEGDELTAEGVKAALDIGSRLSGDYDVLVSTGTQRATQTLACFLAGLGQKVPNGVLVEHGLRSDSEGRWRDAYAEAGSGELDALRAADADLFEEDSAALGAALRRVLDFLADGQRALVVGHSPMSEAAIFHVTGERVPPLSKGAGVAVVAEGERFRVTELS